MENNIKKSSTIIPEFSKFAKTCGFDCEIRKNEKDQLWLGRKVFGISFSWEWDMKSIKTPFEIIDFVYSSGKNLKFFEEFQSNKTNTLEFKQENDDINLTIDKTTNVSINILQNKLAFKRCLKVLDNREQYRSLFSGNNGALQIHNVPQIQDLFFSDFFSKLLKKGQSKSRFKINGTRIFVSKNLKEISIVLEKIGQGTSNAVYKVFDLLKKENRALRKTHPEYKAPAKPMLIKQYKYAVEGMESGFEILQELNENGPVPGIPSAPKQITLFENKTGITKSFISIDLVSCDLFEMIFQKSGKKFFGMELKKQLTLLKDIIEGLAFSHKLGIVHGDIKAENILVKLNDKKEPESVFIGDWDGAIKNADKLPHAITCCCFPYSIYMSQIWNLEEIKKCDVFALCLTLLEVLTRTDLSLETELINGNKFPKFFDENSKNTQERIMHLLKNTPLIDGRGKPNLKGITLPKKLVLLLLKGISSCAPSIDVLLEKYKKILERL